jgi:hypothetical protein
LIINEALANLFWPGREAIGQKVRFGADEKYAEVVGVTPPANTARSEKKRAPTSIGRSGSKLTQT